MLFGFRLVSALLRCFSFQFLRVQTTACAGFTVSSGTSRPGAVTFVHLGESLIIFFPHTSDAQLLHVVVGSDVRLRELAVLAEDDVETHPRYSEAYEYQCCKKYFHVRDFFTSCKYTTKKQYWPNPRYMAICQNPVRPVIYYKLEDELSADRLVVAYLLDNSCESLSHGNDLDLALVHVRV